MRRHLLTLALLPVLGACTLAPTLPGPAKAPPPRPAPAATQDGAFEAPRVRQGRYTLVSTAPLPGQRDLLAQLIDSRIPTELNPSVQDALQHVLRRSGYGLCPPSPALAVLYSRPLPAAHYRLGPMPLREALQLLAGNAWQLQVDEFNRSLCFGRVAPVPSPFPASSTAPEPRP